MDPLSGKKILLVITKSNWGGAQSYVYTLAKAYAGMGAFVSVALGGTGEAGADTGLLAKRLDEAKIPTHFLPSFSRNISASLDVAALTELRALIRKERPDILHLNSSKAGGIGALAGRLEGVTRIIFTAHGWAHREPRPTFKKILIRLSSWLTILLAHAVIVVSQRDYKDAPVFFSKKKIVLITNGIAPFPLADRAAAREKLASLQPIPRDGTWLLMIAELHENKGLDTAITALPEVLKDYPNAMLAVIGEGEKRKELEELIGTLNLKGHVFLFGFVQDPRTYLTAADLFLIPSRKEGLPFALLEAGLAELPVIATSVGGIPEVIRSGINGLLIKPNDTAALSASIKKLLADPKEARDMGFKLHTEVSERFSEKKMLEKTVAVYLH